MSTDLTAMTAAELVAELAKHRNTKDLGIRLAMIGIRAELDARRKDQLACIGGIENSDGSFSFPPAEFMIYSVCIKDANETEWKSAINAAIEAITNEARNDYK